MKYLLSALLVGGALMLGTATAARAQTIDDGTGTLAPTSTVAYPKVSDLTPFSVETDYMSLAGFLRLEVFQRDGIWMDRTEATAIVGNQIATGE